MGGGGQPKIPDAPKTESASAAYKAGVKTDLKYAPLQAWQEYQLRSQYAPQYARLAGDMYATLAPRIASVNMKTLRKIDPESIDGRKALYSRVSADLARGHELDPAFASQVQQYIRGAQAARGNVLGNAPAAAEAIFEGEAAQRMYQQRLSNMGDFLRAPAPEDRFASLMGAGGPLVTAATASAASPTPFQFIDSNAGQAGQAAATNAERTALDRWRFQAGLAGGGKSNPWMGALGGAASGAAAGTAIYPGIGTAIGAVVGGVGGYVATM